MKQQISTSQNQETLSNVYLSLVKSAPYLSKEDELACLKAWQEKGDKRKLDLLTRSYLRFVIKIAYSFKGYNLPLDDLISEGTIGLIQAINKYDPSFETRLSTYSIFWIRAAIQDYVLKNWSLVKLGSSVSQKKIFFNLRKLKSKLGILQDGDMSENNFRQVQDELQVSDDTLIAMNRRLTQSDFSLDAPLNDESQSSHIDLISDSTYQPDIIVEKSFDYNKKREILDQALMSLSFRERKILHDRKLAQDIKTLEELAQFFQISRERVRQIEVSSEKKLKKQTIRLMSLSKKESLVQSEQIDKNIAGNATKKLDVYNNNLIDNFDYIANSNSDINKNFDYLTKDSNLVDKKTDNIYRINKQQAKLESKLEQEQAQPVA